MFHSSKCSAILRCRRSNKVLGRLYKPISKCMHAQLQGLPRRDDLHLLSFSPRPGFGCIETAAAAARPIFAAAAARCQVAKTLSDKSFISQRRRRRRRAQVGGRPLRGPEISKCSDEEEHFYTRVEDFPPRSRWLELHCAVLSGSLNSQEESSIIVYVPIFEPI